MVILSPTFHEKYSIQARQNCDASQEVCSDNGREFLGENIVAGKLNINRNSWSELYI